MNQLEYLANIEYFSHTFRSVWSMFNMFYQGPIGLGEPGSRRKSPSYSTNFLDTTAGLPENPLQNQVWFQTEAVTGSFFGYPIRLHMHGTNTATPNVAWTFKFLIMELNDDSNYYTTRLERSATIKTPTQDESFKLGEFFGIWANHQLGYRPLT